MKHAQSTFTAVALVLSVGGVAPHAAGSPSISDAAIHRMLVTRVDLQHHATGVVVGIVDPAGTRIISYGVTRRHGGKPVDGNTVFGIGSITKVFTALLLSDAAQRGTVNLDAPVGDFLPRAVSVPAFAGKPITLLDLATQTSGLPLRPTNLESGCCRGFTLDQIVKDESSEYAGYGVEDLYRFLSSYRLTYVPGSRYRYSNVGYGLLAVALARRMGGSYPDLIHRYVTAPLGMRQTREDLTPAMRRRLAAGYLYYGGRLLARPKEKFGALQGAAAFYSSAKDLLRFLDAVLGFRKSALRPAMHAMLEVRRAGGMAPPHVTTGTTRIAMAWNIYVDRGREIVWKNGSVSGYRSFIGYDPARRLGVVALANAQSTLGVDDIGLHILDASIPVDMQIPATYREVVLKPQTLDRYVGTYRYSSTDIITIARCGNHLCVSAAGEPTIELFAYGHGKFFMKTLHVRITFRDVEKDRATRAVWHQSGASETGVRIE